MSEYYIENVKISWHMLVYSILTSTTHKQKNGTRFTTSTVQNKTHLKHNNLQTYSSFVKLKIKRFTALFLL